MKDNKILITGGCGFLGSWLTDELLTQGVPPENIMIMDDLSIQQGKYPDYTDKQPVKKVLGGDGDCANNWNVYAECTKFDPDLIFLLAVHPLPESLIHPYFNFVTNTTIVLNILDEIQRNRPKCRLVSFSSSEVYGTMEDHVLTEDAPKHPTTPYAASKLACDMLIESYVETFGIDAVIVRPFNTIGKRQNSGTYAAVIPKTIQRIREGEKPLITWDGLQRRDFTDCSDVVKGAILAAEKGQTGETYNLCKGYGISIEYIVTTIAELMGYTGEILREPKRPGDVRQHIGDNTRAREELGWEPKVKMREALERIVDVAI